MFASVTIADRAIDGRYGAPRRRPSGRHASAHDKTGFDLRHGGVFDSSAPVVVGGTTEAALVSLEPAGTVSLAVALQLYGDND